MISETTAQKQYYSRPDDEKYPTLEALKAAADLAKTNARTSAIRTADLRFEASGDPTNPIHMYGPTGTRAGFTPWSFAQVCGFLRSPADYLRRQQADLASACLQADALRAARIGPGRNNDEENGQGFRADHRLLLDIGGSVPILRAMNSTRYARLYDSDMLRIVDRARANNPNLDLPPVWEGGKGGAYRSDRDMFLIMTDGGSIVPDTTVRGAKDGQMFRGIIIGNSEVGAGCATVQCFWLRTICGNLLLSGIESVIDFSRRHVGGQFHGEVARALQAAQDWLSRPESEDRKWIDACAQTRIASTPDATVETLARWLRLPQATAEAAIKAAQTHEDCDPCSVWGAWQGLTRISQDRQHFADRLTLDTLAATLPTRAKVRVAA